MQAVCCSCSYDVLPVYKLLVAHVRRMCCEKMSTLMLSLCSYSTLADQKQLRNHSIPTQLFGRTTYHTNMKCYKGLRIPNVTRTSYLGPCGSKNILQYTWKKWGNASSSGKLDGCQTGLTPHVYTTRSIGSSCRFTAGRFQVVCIDALLWK